MNKTRSVVLALVCAGAASVGASTLDLAAQGRPDGALILAIPDSYPEGNGPAIIVRSAGQPDVILMDARHVNADLAGATVSLLRRLRSKPIPLGKTQVVRVEGVARLKQTRRADPELDRWLDELRVQPSTTIGNLGTGRWLEVHR